MKIFVVVHRRVTDAGKIQHYVTTRDDCESLEQYLEKHYNAKHVVQHRVVGHKLIDIDLSSLCPCCQKPMIIE